MEEKEKSLNTKCRSIFSKALAPGLPFASEKNFVLIFNVKKFLC